MAHATELAILTGIVVSPVVGAFELVSNFGLFWSYEPDASNPSRRRRSETEGGMDQIKKAKRRRKATATVISIQNYHYGE